MWAYPADLWGCDCYTLSRERSQREDYKWQPVAHYHRRSRGAQERQTGTDTTNRTKTEARQYNRSSRFKFSGVYDSCQLRREKVVAMGAVLAAETVICHGPPVWQWQPQTKPRKSGAPKLPISLIRRDIAFSQQSAHRCYTSLQLFLRLAKPASLWRYAVCLLPFLIWPSLSPFKYATAS